METCKSCGCFGTILSICGKCSDCFGLAFDGKAYDGYVPSELGIGDGDYISFKYCYNCGQIQSDVFPIPNSVVNNLFQDDYME